MSLNTYTNHIAIFVPSMRGGGAERVMLTLANVFAERGHQVDLVLAKAEGPYLSELSDKVRLVDLDVPRVLRSLWPLMRYLQRERPDALLSAMGHANIVAITARFLARVPTNIVVSERANFSMSKKNANSLRAKMMGSLMYVAYRHVDGIVAISSGVADDLAAQLKLPRQKINVVYNPLDIHNVQKLSRLESAYDLSEPRPYKLIVGVGRLVEQKKFSNLITAFSKLKLLKPVRLCILGEGPLRVHLEAEIEQLGLSKEVTLTGFLENPFALLRCADLFVLSSGWEGFGNVLVEAMACGTPVVSTACPSGPEEILENGKWGRLVPVDDIEALTEAMMATLNEEENPEVEVRASDFSVERAVDGYLDVMLPNHGRGINERSNQ